MWNEETWKDSLSECACGNAEAMLGMTQKQQRKYVRNAMKQCDVVYVIWHVDDDQHIWRIKGNDIPAGQQVAIAAIVVDGVETAKAMRREWGDGPTSPHWRRRE
jgi:hypothetical protein